MHSQGEPREARLHRVAPFFPRRIAFVRLAVLFFALLLAPVARSAPCTAITPLAGITASVDEGETVIITLDADPTSTGDTPLIVGAPAKGKLYNVLADGTTLGTEIIADPVGVVENADYKVAFVGAADESGADTFSFAMGDGVCVPDASTAEDVAVTISGVNDAPDVTVPDAFLLSEGTTADFTGPIGITDADSSAAFSVTVSMSAGFLTFSSFAGPATFSLPHSPKPSFLVQGSLADVLDALTRLQIVAEPAGAYTLTVQVADDGKWVDDGSNVDNVLHTKTTTVTVPVTVVGSASAFTVASDGPGTFVAATSVTLASYTVTVVDVNGVALGAFDATPRAVSLDAGGSEIATGIDTADGTAVVASPSVASPLTDSLTLLFHVNGLTSVSLDVTITPGAPVALALSSASTSYPADATVNLADLDVTAVDVVGNTVGTSYSGPSFITLTITRQGGDAADTDGSTLLVTLTNGVATFDNVKVNNALAGAFDAVVSNGDLSDATLVLTITTGVAHAGHISAPASVSVATSSASAVGDVTFVVRDVVGNTLASDSQDRAVTITCATAKVVDGTGGWTTTSGTPSVVVSGLVLEGLDGVTDGPAHGDHILVFSGAGLTTSAELTVTVTAGSPHELVVAGGYPTSLGAAASVALGPYSVSVVDAAGEVVGDDDGETVTLTISGGLTLAGTTVATVGSGVALLNSASLTSPAHGTYTVTLTSSSGGITSSTTTVSLSIVAGAPVALDASLASGSAVLTSGGTTVPDITVDVHDAVGEDLDGSDTLSSRTIRVEAFAEAGCTGTKMPISEQFAAMTSGEATISGLVIEATLVSTVSFRVSSAPLTSACVDLGLTHGAAVALAFENGATPTLDDVVAADAQVNTLSASVNLRIVDFGGNVVTGDAPRTVSVTVTSGACVSCFDAHLPFQFATASGAATLADLPLTSPLSGTYTFELAVSGPLVPLELSITVVAGAPTALVISQQPGATYQADASVAISTVVGHFADAVGNLVGSLTATDLEATLVDAGGDAVADILDGTTTIADHSTGSFSFSSLVLLAPTEATYKIRVTADGGPSVDSDGIAITTGNAAALTSDLATLSFDADETVAIPSHAVQSVDLHGTECGAVDTTVREITLVVRAQPSGDVVAAGGSLAQTMSDGSVTFADVSLALPLAGDYTLTYSDAQGLPDVVVTITVVPGDANKIVLTTSDSVSLATAESVNIGNVGIQVQDVAGNDVDPDTELTITVAGAFVTAVGPFTTVAGAITISSVVLGTPTHGDVVVTFASAALGSSVTVTVTVSPGDNVGFEAVTLPSYDAGFDLAIAAFDLYLVDVSGGRTLSGGFTIDTITAPGLEPVTFSDVIVSAGHATVSDLVVGTGGGGAPSGSYTLTIENSEAGIASLDVTLVVVTGAPNKLAVDPLASQLRLTQGGTSLGTVTVDVQDVVGTDVGAGDPLASRSIVIGIHEADASCAADPVDEAAMLVSAGTGTDATLTTSVTELGTYSISFTSLPLATVCITGISLVAGTPSAIALRDDNLALSAAAVASTNLADSPFIVDVVDFAGNALGALDASSRDITFVLDSDPCGSTDCDAGDQTSATTDGSVQVTSLLVNTPVAGTYTFAVATAGLDGFTLDAQVVAGPFAAIRVAAPTPQQTAAALELGDVVIETLDAGGNEAAAFAARDLLVTFADAATDNVVLTGTTTVSVTGSAVTVSDLVATDPGVGTHTVTVATVDGDVISGSVAIELTTGQAVALAAAMDSLSYASGATVQLDDLVVTGLDHLGAEAGAADASRTVTVTVTGPDTTPADTTGSVLSATMTDGVVTFDSLVLVLPVVGDHVIDIVGGGGVTAAVVTVTVTAGAAHALVVVDPVPISIVTDITVTVPAVTVRVVDIAGNALLTADGDDRSIAVTSSVAVSGGPYTSTDGVAIANGIELTRPSSVVPVTLTFATSGLGDTTVTLDVAGGLEVGFEAVALPASSFATASSVLVPEFHVYTVDAAGVRVLAANAVDGTVTLAIGGVSFTSDDEDLVDGVATFDNVRLAAPTPGATYTMTFSSGSLDQATVDFSVTIGLPVAVALTIPASTVLDAPTPIGTVAVAIRDASGTDVGALDTLSSRTVAISVHSGNDCSGASVFSASIGVTSGVGQDATFAIQDASPGTYSVLAVSAPLTGACGQISVTVAAGDSLAVVDAPLDLSFEADTTVNVAATPIGIKLVDFAGNDVGAADAGSPRTVTVTLTAGPCLACQESVVEVTLTDGVGTISSLPLASPPAGSYQFTIASADLDDVVLPVVIRYGSPVSLRVDQVPTTSYKTASTVALSSISLSVRDVVGNVVETLDESADAVVTVVGTPSGPGSVSLGAATTVSTTDGSLITFDQLVLSTPDVGAYSLSFEIDGLTAATQAITITIGLPVALDSAFAESQSIASRAVSALADHQVFASDVTGAHSLAVDDQTRTITLAVTRDEDGQDADTTGSTLTATMTNGVASFTGLALLAPVSGAYTLTYSADDLTGDTVAFSVIVGPPTALVVVQPTSIPDVGSANPLLVPSFTVRVVDAGGNFVADDSPSRDLSIDTGAAVAPTAATTNGEAIITGLSVSDPVHGDLSLAVTTADLAGTAFVIRVVTGAGDDFDDDVALAVTEYQTLAAVRLADIHIYIVDASRERTGSGSATLTADDVLVSPALDIAMEDTVIADGVATISTLDLVNPASGTTYTVTISSGTFAVSFDVDIVIGPPVQLLGSLDEDEFTLTSGGTALTGLQVTVADHQDTAVGAGDPLASRTIVVAVHGGAVCGGDGSIVGVLSATGGSATGFDDELLDNPIGSYSLSLVSRPLAAACVPFTIAVGSPFALVLADAPLAVSRPSSAATNLAADGDIRVHVVDFAGNALGAVDSTVRTITATIDGVSCPACQADPSSDAVASEDGEAVFAEIGIALPPSGEHDVVFSADGLESVTLRVTITPGDVHSLLVTSATSQSHETDDEVCLDDVTFVALDEAENEIETMGAITVLVNWGPVGHASSETLTTVASFEGGAGSAASASLCLAAPATASYELRLVSTAVDDDAVISVAVTTGQPITLESTLGTLEFTAAATVTIPAHTVRGLDREDTPVGAVDSGSRTISVTIDAPGDSSVETSTEGGSEAGDGEAGDGETGGGETSGSSGGGTASGSTGGTTSGSTGGDAASGSTGGAASGSTGGGSSGASEPDVGDEVEDTGCAHATATGATVAVVMVDGVATIPDIELSLPVAGTYTLTYAVCSGDHLPDETISITMTAGSAARLAVESPPASVELETAPLVSVGDFVVFVEDVAGNQVASADGTHALTLTCLSGCTLQGETGHETADAAVTVSGLALVAPSHSDAHSIQLAADGLESATLSLAIVGGAATSLVIADGYPTSLASAASLVTGPWSIVAEDAAGVAVSGVHAGVVRDVSVAVSGTATGTDDVEMDSGSVVFSTIALTAPPAGDYTFEFTSAGLDSATATVTVTLGLPVSLFASLPSTSLVAGVPTSFGLLSIEERDAASARVVDGDNPVSARTVSVSIHNGAGCSGDVLSDECTELDAGELDVALSTTAAAGAYSVFVQASPLASFCIDTVITIGDAFALRTDTVLAPSVASAASVDLFADDVRVAVVDVAGNELGAADVEERQVAVTLQAASPCDACYAEPATTTSEDGVATLDALVLANAVPGSYSFTISSSDLESVSFAATVVVGAAYRLSVVGTAAAVRSEPNTLLPAISLVTQDAGGSDLVGRDAVTHQVSLACATLMLDGETDGPLAMANGRLLVSGLVATNAAAGAHDIVVSAPGLVSVTATVTVSIGDAVALASGTFTPVALAADVETNVFAIQLVALDAGGSATGAADSLDRDVSVAVQGDTVELGGTTTVAMVDGVVVFGDLTLASPVVGSYQLVFSAVDLAPHTVQVDVVGGPAFSLYIASPAEADTVASRLPATLSDITVGTKDAAGNVVDDGATYTISVAVEAVDIADHGTTVDLLSGTATVASGSGTALFDDLAFRSPATGDWLLRFTADGLSSAAFDVVVIVGSSQRVDAYDVGRFEDPDTCNVGGEISVLSFPTVDSLALGTYRVRFLDAGFNVVTEEAGSIRAETDMPDSVGFVTRALNGGVASFTSFSSTAPPPGTYTITFASSGKVDDTVEVEVTIGPAKSVRVTEPNVLEVVADTVVDIGDWVIDVLDASETIRTIDGDRDVTVTSAGPLDGALTGDTSATVTAGTRTIELGFAAPLAGTYTLTFSADGLLSDSVDVVVVPGAPFALAVVGDASLVSGLKTQVETHLPGVYVTIEDVNGNVIPDDATARTLLVSIDGDAVISAGAETAFTGEVDMDDAITLASPAPALYTLTFAAAGLESDTLSVLVESGLAVSMIIDVSGSEIYSTQVDTPIDSITIIALDAAGDRVLPSAAVARTVTATLNVDDVLTGSPVLTMEDGEVVFGDLSLSSPPAGLYVLTFSTPDFESIEFEFEVAVGDARALIARWVDADSTTADAPMAVPSLIVETVDVLGATLGDSDETDRTISASVELSTGPDCASDGVVLGTGTASMVDGLVQFSFNMDPTATGTFAVQLSSDPIVEPTCLLLTVDFGVAAQLVIAGPASYSVKTALEAELETIRVDIADAGGNSLESDTDPGYALTMTCVADDAEDECNLADGTGQEQSGSFEAVFARVRLLRPDLGTYTLQIVSDPALDPVSLDLEIVAGDGTTLSVVDNDDQLVEAARVTELHLISVAVLDAAGTNLEDVDDVTRTIDLVLPEGLGDKTISLETSNGTVFFYHTDVGRPSAGEYMVTIDSLGLESTTVAVEIVVGQPALIAFADDMPEQLAVSSTTVSTVPTVTVVGLDAAGALVGTAQTDIVTVEMTSSDIVLRGIVQVAMVDGEATFDAATLSNPPIGNYTLQFASEQLDNNVTVVLHVTTGLPVSLTVQRPSNFRTTYESREWTYLDTMTVSGLDAGGSPATIIGDVEDREVTAYITGRNSNATRLTEPWNNGRSIFRGLAIRAPETGTYVVHFEASDQLAQTNVSLTISVGPATSLTGFFGALTGNTFIRSSSRPEVFSASIVFLEAFEVLLLDAGGNVVGSLDRANRTISWSVPGIAMRRGVRTTQALDDGYARVLAVPELLQPAPGTHNVVVSSAGLDDAYLSFLVNPGLPFGMYIVPLFDTSMAISSATSVIVGRVEVGVVDAGNSRLSDVREVIPYTVSASRHFFDATRLDTAFSPASVAPSDVSLTKSEIDGLSVDTFEVRLRRPPAGILELEFASAGLVSAYVNVTIVSGTPSSLGTSGQPGVSKATDPIVTEGVTPSAAKSRTGVPVVTISLADESGNFAAEDGTPVRATLRLVRRSANSGQALAVEDEPETPPGGSNSTSGASSNTTAAVNGTAGAAGTASIQRRATQLIVSAIDRTVKADDPGRRRSPGRAQTLDVSDQMHLAMLQIDGATNGTNGTMTNETVVEEPEFYVCRVDGLVGTTERAVAGGSVSFDDLELLDPCMGDYQIVYSAPGLESIAVTVIVGAGAGERLYFTTRPSSIVSNDRPVPQQPRLQLADRYGNNVAKANVVVSTTVFPRETSVVVDQALNTAKSNANGEIVFTNLAFNGYRGNFYSLVFSANDETIRVLTMPNVQVEGCTGERVGQLFSCVCRPGFYIAGDICLACPLGTYQPLPDQISCISCPSNMATLLSGETSDSACVCRADFFNRAFYDGKKDEVQCEACPDEAQCDGGNHIEPRPGYWRLGPEYLEFLECPNRNNCRGGNTDVCITGTEGPLCETCSDGYGEIGPVCVRCPSTAVSWLATGAILVFIGMVIVFLAYSAQRLNKDTGSGLQKIFLNWVQMMGLVGEFPLNFPPSVTQVFNFAGGASMIGSRIWSLDCTLKMDYFAKFRAQVAMPFICLGIITLVLGVYMIFRYFRPRNEEDGQPEKFIFLRTRVISVGIATLCVIIFLTHPLITKECLQVFNCLEFEDGVQRLVVDYNVVCGTTEHQATIVISSIMIAFYVIGVPISGVILLWWLRDRLWERKIKQRVQILFEGFRKDRFYWEMVIMFRKIIVVGIIVFLRNSPAAQTYAGLWLVLGSIALHTYMRPFATPELQRAELASLCITFFTLMVGLLYQTLETVTEEVEYTFSFAVLLVNGVAFISFIVFIIRRQPVVRSWFRRAWRFVTCARQEKGVVVEKEIVMFEQFAQQDEAFKAMLGKMDTSRKDSVHIHVNPATGARSAPPATSGAATSLGLGTAALVASSRARTPNGGSRPVLNPVVSELRKSQSMLNLMGAADHVRAVDSGLEDNWASIDETIKQLRASASETSLKTPRKLSPLVPEGGTPADLPPLMPKFAAKSPLAPAGGSDDGMLLDVSNGAGRITDEDPPPPPISAIPALAPDSAPKTGSPAGHGRRHSVVNPDADEGEEYYSSEYEEVEAYETDDDGVGASNPGAPGSQSTPVKRFRLPSGSDADLSASPSRAEAKLDNA